MYRPTLLAAALLAASAPAALAAPLTDISPTDVSPFMVSNGDHVVFWGKDGVSPIGDPWRSDGTPAGTVRIKAVAGSQGQVDVIAVANGGRVFFRLNDGFSGNQLWRTDGTADGTFALTTFTSTTDGGIFTPFPVGDATWFSTNTNLGRKMYRTDGTAIGTVVAPPSNYVTDRVFAHLDGRVVFRGNVTATPANKLLVTDGTSGGTSELLPDLLAIPAPQAAVNGQLFFPGSDATNGTELWRTRGTAATTGIVANIAAGNAGSSPTELARVGDRLYFSAIEATGGRELWITDGLAANTRRVKDIRAGLADGDPRGIVDLDGVALFFANDGTHGSELWRSDGTEAGTTMVRDLTPGSASSTPDKSLRIVNDVAYFVVGGRLWRSDGTSDGTRVVDPAAGVSNSVPGASANGKLFVSANGGVATLDLLAYEGPTWCAQDERPIGDAGPAASTIRLPQHQALQDLDLSIDLFHPEVGDLVATLRHHETNTTVTLFDRLPNVALGRPCGGDLVDVVLDDEATLAAATQCTEARDALPANARLRPLQPLTAFDGQDFGGTWTLTITDANPGGGLRGTAHGWCLRGTVANLAPVATDASFSIAENAANGQQVGTVPASDPNLDPLAFELTAGNADGAFAIDAAGLVTVANAAALDHESAPSRVLTVTARDDGAPPLTDTATVSIAVTNVPEPAIAVDDAFVVAQGSGASPLTVLANDTDPEGDAFAIDIVGAAAHGSVVRASYDLGHVLEYTPASGYCNTAPGGSPDTFTYEVSGGDSATVSITVTCQSGDGLFASGFE